MHDPVATLDLRFARIALDRGYVTGSEVTDAFGDQALGSRGSGHVPTVAQLLLEHGAISYEQTESVLDEMFEPTVDDGWPSEPVLAGAAAVPVLA